MCGKTITIKIFAPAGTVQDIGVGWRLSFWVGMETSLSCGSTLFTTTRAGWGWTTP